MAYSGIGWDDCSRVGYTALFRLAIRFRISSALRQFLPPVENPLRHEIEKTQSILLQQFSAFQIVPSFDGGESLMISHVTLQRRH